MRGFIGMNARAHLLPHGLDEGEGGFDCLAFRLTDPGPKQQRLHVAPRPAERILPLTEKFQCHGSSWAICRAG